MHDVLNVLPKCISFKNEISLLIYELSSQWLHNIIIVLRFCSFHRQLITTRPATIHYSQAAQACNHHGVQQTVAVLHWPRHQWVASPAGMCRPTARTTHCTLVLNESGQFYVFDTVYFFVCWDIANTFHVQFLGHPICIRMSWRELDELEYQQWVFVSSTVTMTNYDSTFT